TMSRQVLEPTSVSPMAIPPAACCRRVTRVAGRPPQRSEPNWRGSRQVLPLRRPVLDQRIYAAARQQFRRVAETAPREHQGKVSAPARVAGSGLRKGREPTLHNFTWPRSFSNALTPNDLWRASTPTDRKESQMSDQSQPQSPTQPNGYRRRRR